MKKLLKLNKNILLTFSILIVLAVIFTPTLKDLTGKVPASADINVIGQDIDGRLNLEGATVQLWQTGPVTLIDQGALDSNSKIIFEDTPIGGTYFIKISKEGYKTWSGTECPFVLNQERSFLITLEGGSGISVSCTESPASESLFDVCTQGLDTYTSRRLSGTGVDHPPAGKCTLKVYKDNTYDVVCDNNPLAPWQVCTGFTSTSLDIKNIDDNIIKNNLNQITQASEYLCFSSTTERHIEIVHLMETNELQLKMDVMFCWNGKYSGCTADCVRCAGWKYDLTCNVNLPSAISVACTAGEQLDTNNDNNLDSYCDDDQLSQPLKSVDDSCTENYECESNFCENDKCSTAGLNLVNIVSTLYGPDNKSYYNFIVYDSDTTNLSVKSITGTDIPISNIGYTSQRLSEAQVPVGTSIKVGFKNNEFLETGDNCVDFVSYKDGNEISRDRDCTTSETGWWVEDFASYTEKTVVIKLENLGSISGQPLVHENGAAYELNSTKSVEVSWFTPKIVCPSGSGSICVEAENFTINNFKLLINKIASKGILLTTLTGGNTDCNAIAPTSPSLIRIVNITSEGVYHLQARTIAPSASSNSLCVQIDSRPIESWNLLISADLMWLTKSSYNLTKGLHTLKIYPKKTGVSIDTVRLSKTICNTNSDCSAGELCQHGVCISQDLFVQFEPEEPEVCNDNQDNDGDSLIDCSDIDCSGQTCATNKLCYQGSCITPECTSADNCDDDEICDDDYTCLQVECKEDDDCTDELCDTSANTCVQCVEDEDCDDDEICDDNECETIDECNSASDCGSDEVCTSGICEAEDCDEHWDCSAWSACTGTQQTRTCSDANSCGTTNYKPEEIHTCTPSLAGPATCSDGIQNQNEESVDCGGPCMTTCDSCYDNKQNCHDEACETGLDCGGSCSPCIIVDAGSSATFWLIFIAVLLILIVLVVGFWYFKLKKDAGEVGQAVDSFSRRPPSIPPTQPSSLLRI